MAAPVIQKAYIQDINRPIETRHGGGLMFTGDANADRISVALYDCQTPFALSGSVTGTCIRDDGQTVVLTGGIIDGNTAYVVLEQSCFVVPGSLTVTIRVSAGGVNTTVLKAVYTVDQTTTEEIVDPGHVVPDVSDIVAEYARMQAASDAAEAAAANANEAAQFATDDEWTNGDTLQTGRVYQTLHMANFDEETAGQYLRVISGNVAQAERVNQSGWSVYRYDLPHRMLIRLEAIEKNTPTVQGVLPMAAVLTSGSTETLYSLDSDRTGTYILADALLCNYNTTLNASAIKSVSITAVANRQFEDVIVCLDHAADFDKIVVFGDSIFANYINSTTVGNGVMAQFASLMGLPVVNNAVGGATLSTIQTSPKNVVQQVQDYIASATPGGTPLYMIDGGTNDQYNNGAGLANLGQYTDGVNGITNTIYGATYAIINALLGFGVQPWQIVICTPIPKGIRGDAAYVATMDAQLTAIAGAMAEIAMVQQCNVINGYGAPFDNLTSDTAKAVLMPDDTHPSVYGAKLYAERIFRLLGAAMQPEVASLKSALGDVENAVGYYPNLWNPAAVVEGKYYANGAEVSNASYHYIIIECAPGEKFYFGNNGTASQARFVNELTSGGANLYTRENITNLTTAEGCGKIAVTFNVSNTKPQINKGALNPYVEYGKTMLESQIDTLSDGLDDTNNDVSAIHTHLDNITQLEYGKNRFNPAGNVSGYVNTSDGTITSNDSNSSSDFVEIGANAVLSFGYNIGNVSTLRCALYDASKSYIASSGSTPSLTYSSTLNRYYYILQTNGTAKYVRFSMSNTAWENSRCKAQVENGTSPTAYEAYTAPITVIAPDAMPEELFDKTGDNVTLNNDAMPEAAQRQIFASKSYEKEVAAAMADEDEIEIDITTSLKQRFTLAFKANVTTFSAVKLCQGTSSSVVVDNTNVYLYNATTLMDTEAHGLTISNNIDIVLNYIGASEIDVIIVSDGEKSKVTLSGYQNSRATGYSAISDGSTLTDCEFVWRPIMPHSKIWMFGDSYISYANIRWLYYLTDAGFANNAMIDGYPGESGAIGMNSFETLLSYDTPKIAVYMLGMNDGSDQNVSPSTWRTPREKFVELCKKYNILPIFTLIPTVPTIRNDAKNTWVKDNGYRYIDFYGAVGADTSGNWYTGMLDADGIHPTAKGAKALFGQLLVDLPEIMND